MLSNGQVGWVSLGGQCGIKWAKDILTGRIPDRWCVVDGWGTMVIKEWEWHCENNEEEYKNKTWKGFRCETLFQMDVGWIPLVLLKVKYMFFILFMRRDKREQVTKRRGWSLVWTFFEGVTGRWQVWCWVGQWQTAITWSCMEWVRAMVWGMSSEIG